MFLISNVLDISLFITLDFNMALCCVLYEAFHETMSGNALSFIFADVAAQLSTLDRVMTGTER